MKWFRIGSIAALDQMLLSVLNFAVSIAFIRFGGKSEYGLYVILLGLINLVQGFQNAIFISPFATLHPQREENGRLSLVRFLIWGQVGFGAFAAFFSMLALAISFIFFDILSTSASISLALGFFLAILGTMAREASRAYHYTCHRAGAALSGDLFFGFILVVGLATMIMQTGVTTTGVLLCTGLAGLLLLIGSVLRGPFPSIQGWRIEALEFWRCGRWAIIGVVISWININFLGFAAAAAFGLSAVAEINAARLFMMPLVLGLPVWSNLLRPRFSQWFAEQKFKKMRTVTNISAGIGTGLVIVYIAVISTAYPWLEKIIGPAYAGILPMIVAWAGFYMVVTIRTVLMASLMVNEAGYKSLSKVSSVGLILLGPSMLIATQGGAVWMVYALIIIEIGQTYLVWRWAREYWQGVVNV